MDVSYSKLLNKIKQSGKTQKVFREESGISNVTFRKFMYNENVTVDSICKVCDYFGCMPDEIMDWIPNEELMKAKREEKRLETERQIAELQAKLKEL